MFKLIGIPLLLLHLLGLLDDLVRVLESISVNVGNIELSAYGIVRVASIQLRSSTSVSKGP